MKKVLLLLGAFAALFIACDKNEMNEGIDVPQMATTEHSSQMEMLNVGLIANKHLGLDEVSLVRKNPATYADLEFVKNEIEKEQKAARRINARLVTDTLIVNQYVKVKEGDVNWSDSPDYWPMNNSAGTATYYIILNSPDGDIYFNIPVINSVVYMKTDVSFRAWIVSEGLVSKLGTVRNPVIFKSDLSHLKTHWSTWPTPVNDRFISLNHWIDNGHKQKSFTYANGSYDRFYNFNFWIQDGPVLDQFVLVQRIIASITPGNKIKVIFDYPDGFAFKYPYDDSRLVSEKIIGIYEKATLNNGVFNKAFEVKHILMNHRISDQGRESWHRQYHLFKRNGIVNLKFFSKIFWNNTNKEVGWSMSKYKQQRTGTQVETLKMESYSKSYNSFGRGEYRYSVDYEQVVDNLDHINFYFDDTIN